MSRHAWISKRAYYLWEQAGRPDHSDVSFWLSAEHDYDRHRLCILTPGSCPFQESKPTTGGKHVAICLADADAEMCRNRAEMMLC